MLDLLQEEFGNLKAEALNGNPSLKIMEQLQLEQLISIKKTQALFG